MLLEDFSPGTPPPALHSYHPHEKNFVQAPCRVGRCIRAGADRPGNVAPCLSSHDTDWEYAIEVTNEGNVVPLLRRDDGEPPSYHYHSKSISPIQAGPMPAIAAAFDSVQWKRPPYLAPLSRGSRCRLRSLHGIRADTCAVADDAGFPCPWLISSLCLFYQIRSKYTACRGARPRVPVTKLAYLSPDIDPA